MFIRQIRDGVAEIQQVTALLSREATFDLSMRIVEGNEGCFWFYLNSNYLFLGHSLLQLVELSPTTSYNLIT